MRLIIAEKPSVAKSIAPVVGATQRQNGYFQGNDCIVSWCFGHLVGLYNPREYRSDWAVQGGLTFALLPMIPDSWKFHLNENCEEQFNILKGLMQDSKVTEIICATDADREGECIFRYVYRLAGCTKPVKRLWTSSLEESAIREGLAQMKAGSAYDSLFQAGFSRAKADWLIGMNVSSLFGMRYHDSVHIGRVKTPTLAMIVKRDYDVAHFVKQKYYTVALNCGSFVAESERVDDGDQANRLVSACAGQTAMLTELKKEEKTENPPKLFDLTSLQREANRYFGYSAEQTLEAQQALYEAKLTTYPRTDSQYITDDMEQTALNVASIVLTKFPQFGQAQSINVQRCINNQKVSGHHAILPTANITNADVNKLSEEQRNVLYLISARLILATAEPHRYEAVKATVRCAGTDFTATGKTILHPGWKALEAKANAFLRTGASDEDLDDDKAKALPALAQGQSFENVTAERKEHWTAPPRPYTDATLLSAMERAGNEEYDEDTEKKGLGTPATRAGIIEELIRNNYIQRKGKQLNATEIGIKLISVVPEEVKSPKLTAEWEMQLQQIEHGKGDAGAFLNGIISYIKVLCEKYSVEDKSVSFHQQQEPIGKCPHCGGDVLKGKFGFYCTQKCGMYLAKVYGKVLTDAQMMQLLSGKKTSFVNDGKKTIVFPEAVEHFYNGKTSWVWKTERG